MGKLFTRYRNEHHKFKFRFKSLHRRKKDERLLLDMPTTDPGSDLPISTDDEYIDANGVVTCYGTMPPRIRRHLLKSELQRHYIEEIGCGLKSMPPELIITSPSSKDKHKTHTVRIIYKPAVAEKYERKSQTTNELPFIGQPAKRTRSWHNLNTAKQTYSLSPANKPSTTKYKAQSPFYRTLSKKEVSSKEDLDIQLSLKKKIWTGIQPDDITFGIDRTRPLSWVAPHAAKSKKMTAVQSNVFSNDLTVATVSTSNDFKKLENEAFLTACSRKLMEWQMTNTNPDISPCSETSKVPLKSIARDINQDHSVYIFKNLPDTKTTCLPIVSSKTGKEITSEAQLERSTTISKVVETGRFLTKLSKSKARNNISTTHRAANKKALSEHRSHTLSNKFKTGGLVVTAVQAGGSGGSVAGVKNYKKLKSLHHKLPNVNRTNTNNTECGDPQEPSIISNKANNKNSLVMDTTASTIVRKVKTKKLKKKKLSSTT